MTEVQIRSSPPRSSKSRSPSVGAGSPRGNRKITVIDGTFQSQKASSPSSSENVGSISSPPSRASSLIHQHHSHSYSVISKSNPHILLSPSYGSCSSLKSKSRTVSERTSMSSENLDSVVSNGDDTALFRPHSNHQDVFFPPSSPLSWRSSSSSSLTDSSVAGLVQHPSSEKTILRDIKREMTRNLRRTKDLEKEAKQVPKLKQDVNSLRKERKKLLNELLEERAVVLQLKQRVTLLHQQNQQLAQLARSTSSAGSGGSSQVLAIRNTLVATLAQLSQMEEQVQAIPGLRLQLKEMEEENSQLKQAQSQVVARLPSDLSEEASPADYHSLACENAQLKEANLQLVEEMRMISQHLKAVSDSCDSLQYRMERLQSSQVQAQPYHEQIRKLERDKETLYQEMVDMRFDHKYVTDVDKAHLVKKVASLRKANYKLNARMELMKQEARRQKEQFVTKLFEVEALNIKTSHHELEKRLIGIEQDQLRAVSGSPELTLEHCDEDEKELRDASPEAHVQLLRFKQLEIHSREFQNVLKVLMADKQELERKVAEMAVVIEERHISEQEQQLQETQSKLELARERIKILEADLRASSAPTSSDDACNSNRNSLKEQVTDLQQQLKRMSKIENASPGSQRQVPELEVLRQSCDRLSAEKNRLERKQREERNKLKAISIELAKASELVNNYQEQCSNLQSELDRTKEELSSLHESHASVKAQLEVSEVEHQSSVKQAVEQASVQAVKEQEEKYQQLFAKLSAVKEQHEASQRELEHRKCRIEELVGQLDTATVASGTFEVQNQTLRKKIAEMEASLEDSHQKMTAKEQEMKSLSERSKRVGELESQQSTLQLSLSQREEELRTLQAEVSSQKENVSELSSQNKSLQQKVDMLSIKTPELTQQATELKVAKDEAERKFSSLRIQQEASRTTIAELQLKLESSERSCRELRAKLDLLQSDLDHAESHLDKANTELESERLKYKDEHKKVEALEEKLGVSAVEAKQQQASLSSKVQQLEHKLQEATTSLDSEKDSCRSLEAQLSQLRAEEVPNLRSELAKTVAEMGQVTTDYSESLTRMQQLETSLEKAKAQSQDLSHKLLTAEKELSHSAQKSSSLTVELQRREKELSELRATHSTALSQSQKLSQTADELRGEVRHLQGKLDNQGDIHSQVSLGLKQECQHLQAELKASQRRTAEVESTLQRKEQDLHKSSAELAGRIKETEELKKKVEHLSNHCEGLTATRDNLMKRLDKMEKLEMDYEMLKRNIQDVLGQSSQLRSDNKALLQFLGEVQTERPVFEKEATRTLQEENLELQQQVSLLSQWNDKHQREREALERKLKEVDSERHKLLVELQQKDNYEQENRQLKKELVEVEVEVNRIKRQKNDEFQEELRVKMETQGQLLHVFNEHNRSLQIQVTKLLKKVKDLGGTTEWERPISPPPMPDISQNAFLQGTSDQGKRLSELEVENAALKQRISRLEAELISAQEISPKIRRRSSNLLAVSSVAWAPINEDAFVSVPEEMLLPCSILADSYINHMELPKEHVQEYLQIIGEKWFSCVAQKSVTAACVQSYTTTFFRLSPKLLDVIINLQDMRGNTALHHTLANSKFKVVAVLLKIKCCNPNITNKAGYTPLMLAAAHNVQCGEHRSVMVQLLCKTNINVRSKVEFQSALMLAVSSGNIELASLFLENGAEINARDRDGSTPLMFACEKGHTQMVQQLLLHPQCDVTIRDNDGQSAYDIAQSGSHQEICTMLKKHEKQARKK